MDDKDERVLYFPLSQSLIYELNEGQNVLSSQLYEIFHDYLMLKLCTHTTASVYDRVDVMLLGRNVKDNDMIDLNNRLSHLMDKANVTERLLKYFNVILQDVKETLYLSVQRYIEKPPLRSMVDFAFTKDFVVFTISTTEIKSKEISHE